MWLHFKQKLVGKCREREKIKTVIPFRSVLTLRVIENSKKIKKKIREIKKYHYGFISSQNWLENAKKERIWRVSFRFIPTRRVTENSKKIAKKSKKLKNTVMCSFQAKIGLKKMRKWENKNYHSVSFLPDGVEKIPKK